MNLAIYYLFTPNRAQKAPLQKPSKTLGFYKVGLCKPNLRNGPSPGPIKLYRYKVYIGKTTPPNLPHAAGEGGGLPLPAAVFRRPQAKQQGSKIEKHTPSKALSKIVIKEYEELRLEETFKNIK